MSSNKGEPPLKPPRLSSGAGVADSFAGQSFPPSYTSNDYRTMTSPSSYKPSTMQDTMSAQDFKGYDNSSFSEFEQGKMTGEMGGATNSEEAFSAKPRWNDVWATLLFLVCLGAFLGVGIFMIIFTDLSPGDLTSFWNPTNAFGLLYISSGCALMSMILASIYLVLLYVFPVFMIYASLVISILIYTGLAIMAFVKRNFWFGILCVISVALYALMYFVWKKRIPFAAAMIRTTGEITFDYKTTYLAAFVALLIEMILTAFWIVAVTATTLYYRVNGVPLVLLYVFFGFSFYWYSQVIKNTLHVTVSGLFASVYLLSGTSRLFRRPVLRAAKNALSYSFGSVCFGSLMVALVQTIRGIVTTFAQNESSIFAFCVDFILSILESIIRMFNQYAFTQIALFGKSYIKAARDTWSMFKRSGFEIIINTSIITNVILLAGTLIGSACGVLAGFWANFGTISSDMVYNKAAYVALMTIVGFFIGFTITIVLLEVVESGASTTLVLLAEYPESIKRTKPNLYAEFEATYGRHLQLG